MKQLRNLKKDYSDARLYQKTCTGTKNEGIQLYQKASDKADAFLKERYINTEVYRVSIQQTIIVTAGWELLAETTITNIKKELFEQLV